jgi:threonine synthase
LTKYFLLCTKCGHITKDFSAWFQENQECVQCNSKHSEVWYNADYAQLKELFLQKPDSFWHYFDFLPLQHKKNIISCKEGAIPVEKWDFLSDYAQKEYGIQCNVLVYRNDLNGGTGTFKDVAASLAASLFKEHGIKQYTIASTGNTATAYSKYLALANVNITVFVPHGVLQDSVAEMISYKQAVRIVEGDYTFAKKMAADFHQQQKVLISAGNIDPIRVEAKKTMVFEFLRQLGSMPDVYIQAVSGGTGPIAIDKGIREIESVEPKAKLPRIVLVQQDTCDPMVQGWEKATKENYPDGWENHYPVIENPQTCVSILSTGNPGMFPVVAPIVKKSGGAFVRVKEQDLIGLASKIFKEKGIVLGPASIVCLLGFYEALRENRIKNGETVLINTGEGVARAQWFEKAVYSRT